MVPVPSVTKSEFSFVAEGTTLPPFMCHGCGMKWTKPETTAKKDSKETAREEERIKKVCEEKVAEKELVPAEWTRLGVAVTPEFTPGNC